MIPATTNRPSPVAVASAEVGAGMAFQKARENILAGLKEAEKAGEASPPVTRVLLETDVDTFIHETRERALEAARAVDGLSDGKRRLAVQGILDAATEAVRALDGDLL